MHMCAVTLTPAALGGGCQVSVYLPRNQKLFCRVSFSQVLDILLPKHAPELLTHTSRSNLLLPTNALKKKKKKQQESPTELVQQDKRGTKPLKRILAMAQMHVVLICNKAKIQENY